MVHVLLNLFRRPAIGTVALLNRRDYQRTTTKNAQFVSFLDDSGFRRVNTDKWERSMRRRRAVAYALLWMMVAGFAWVVIESAQALSLF
ncbi:MAG: hypothetical protein IAE82_04345 [Opitutaceae bacterium]|nr:hypothetical protein [Opitutaceae bacterium]